MLSFVAVGIAVTVARVGATVSKLKVTPVPGVSKKDSTPLPDFALECTVKVTPGLVSPLTA